LYEKCALDIFRTRQSSLERHLPWLDAQWSGCRNGADLWRRLKKQAFRGSLRVVAEWATRRRRAEKADAENLQRIPSSRTIARLMTIGRNNLSKTEIEHLCDARRGWRAAQRRVMDGDEEPAAHARKR
jgi:hypothetical protein